MVGYGEGIEFLDGLKYYRCDGCKYESSELDPWFKNKDSDLCIDCAFIENIIEEKKYLELSGIFIGNAHAAIKDNKIYTWIGRKNPPWEKINNQKRNYIKYQQWREKVFKRDNWTCQDCNNRGGDLEAHHIKSFSKFPKLRLKISNGKTLCIECHRKRTRKEE